MLLDVGLQLSLQVFSPGAKIICPLKAFRHHHDFNDDPAAEDNDLDDDDDDARGGRGRAAK